ncbi:ribbon-helix-helix domain-containing protein [Desulfonauticus submarinus]|uniref:Ribbon-helix-helix protein, copG family n=1 Tax=Desulfonauticus submarinus TaxID=206665 RepID=A0A1G9ZHG1_9BACT|nr:ribbon-helix-helix domain-containing protein [Desulfonauticus submarinus]SDN20892.1 Ribbon-helix-helix protein, copG family [Desulfonauticus submarinus]
MPVSKIAITLDKELVKEVDLLVKSNLFPNRSKAIQEAVKEKLERLKRTRLAKECAKLDPGFEESMAEEGFSMEIEEWPKY